MNRSALTRALLAAGSLLLASGAQAHPHGWIDLSVTVVTDEQGRVTAFDQIWRMDPFYSLIVFDELRNVADATFEEGLDQLGQDIRDNLSAQHYFTRAWLDGEPLALGEVSEYTTYERDSRLVYMFSLPLAEPVALDGARLEYQIYDPTYYIEVVHEEQDGAPAESALTLAGDETSCALGVTQANPDPELVLQAALLDKGDQGEPELGRYFAETGHIDCSES
ncbi:DUF1007 family protein [Halomonas sp. PAMB 3232]|uniref:DUF1007 family protein n=1 Tax=Halomonas sp. PAMB 3232 TaxID=3075221 RepID=UPI00289A0EA7|nr:DUF1007 family protein [Halomonas sp. PAMB 3232]WNL38467.1 DUF1007 family protein [Halomonas sp. PAMB 3232]